MGVRTLEPRGAGDPDLFERLTHDEVWLAGLIWADGCLCEAPRDRHVLIRTVDQGMAEQAAAIAGVTMRRQPDRRENRQDTYTVRIGHRTVVARLVAMGLTPRKSLTAQYPSLPSSRSHRHFIRGYFDGDGCVSRERGKLVSTFVGSRALLVDLRDHLLSEGINARPVGPHGPIFHVRLGHRASLELGRYLYSDGGPFLVRKRERFAAWGV